MPIKIIGENVQNIPWQEKPASARGPVWRFEGNPIIQRDQIACATAIYNSAAVPFEGKFAGVFRVDDMEKRFYLHRGFSDDGFAWTIDEDPIVFDTESEEMRNPVAAGYDPRVTKIDERYYITWCNTYYGPTIGMGYTDDFQSFTQVENAFLPCNRNGVLFPRKINGEYMMLSRPSDRGHTPFGDIFISRSRDLEYWGRHRFVMGTRRGWQSLKLGAGPVPIETSEGWLLIYHGVNQSCSGYLYSAGAALLDLDEPWKVIHRSRIYLFNARELYECVGDVPNVVFPCAALADAASGKIAIYYGAADTVTALAFTTADEIFEFLKTNGC